MSFTIQSTPYRSPSPDRALHPIAPQCLVFTVYSQRKSRICSGVRLLGISCLLQKTNNVAPISFYCFSSACSQFLVSQSLNLSELSTTHMTPSVCSKQLRQQDRIVFCPPISHTLSLQVSYCKDLMLKPSVGDISLISSPLNFLMMVVLPALSRPSTSNLISFYCSFAFFTIDIKPILLFQISRTTFQFKITTSHQIIFFNNLTLKPIPFLHISNPPPFPSHPQPTPFPSQQHLQFIHLRSYRTVSKQSLVTSSLKDQPRSLTNQLVLR